MSIDYAYSSSGDSPAIEELKTSATHFGSNDDSNFSISSSNDYNQVFISDNGFDDQIQENVMKIIEEESYKTLLSPA